MGIVAVLASALGYAVAGMVIARFASRLDALSIAAVRVGVVPFFLVALLFALGSQGDVLRLSTSDIWLLVLAGLIGWGLGETFYALSIHYLGLTRSYMFVTGGYSLGAFLLPVLVLGESVGVEAAGGAVLILAGVYLVALRGVHRNPETAPAPVPHPAPAEEAHPTIAGGAEPVAPRLRLLRAPRFSRVTIGFLLAFGVSLAWAVDSTLIRATSGGVDAVAVAIVHVPGAAFGTVLYVYARPSSALRRRSIEPRAAVIIAVSSILSSGIASVLFIFAIQQIGTGPAAVIFATSPLFALPLAAIVLHERVTVWAVVGTVLAIGGIALLA